MSSLEYKLFTRKPIEIEEGLVLRQHTFAEICDAVGYEAYESVVTCMTRETHDFEYELEKIGIDYKDISYFTLFQMLRLNNEESAKETLKVLGFMFDCCFGVYSDPNIERKNDSDKTIFMSSFDKSRITVDNFHKIRDVLKVMFFIKKTKRRIASSERAKELILRDKKMKAKEVPDIDIYSIMSSLVWNEKSNETYDTIVNLSPYQIYDGYFTIEKIRNYDDLMRGYFNGLIDKEFIVKNKNHWCSKITNKKN